MPITKGQGNPNWTREETILAMDLLVRSDGAIPS
jgi:5-methylcytosine-specific restriction protein A